MYHVLTTIPTRGTAVLQLLLVGMRYLPEHLMMMMTLAKILTAHIQPHFSRQKNNDITVIKCMSLLTEHTSGIPPDTANKVIILIMGCSGKKPITWLPQSEDQVRKTKG